MRSRQHRDHRGAITEAATGVALAVRVVLSVAGHVGHGHGGRREIVMRAVFPSGTIPQLAE